MNGEVVSGPELGGGPSAPGPGDLRRALLMTALAAGCVIVALQLFALWQRRRAERELPELGREVEEYLGIRDEVREYLAARDEFLAWRRQETKRGQEA